MSGDLQIRRAVFSPKSEPTGLAAARFPRAPCRTGELAFNGLRDIPQRPTSGTSILDMGGPLGKSLRVTKTGASPSTNDLGGFSVLQAESKEALAESLKGHPHFMTPEGFIDVIELMPIPGP